MAELPLVIRLLVGLFGVGTLMSGLAIASLLSPGGWLDPLWRLNPEARAAFAAIGGWAYVVLGAICLACLATTAGLLKRRFWGYCLALAMLAANLKGDVATAVVRREAKTLIGVPIAGLLLVYLGRPAVRALFRRPSVPIQEPQTRENP